MFEYIYIYIYVGLLLLKFRIYVIYKSFFDKKKMLIKFLRIIIFIIYIINIQKIVIFSLKIEEIIKIKYW